MLQFYFIVAFVGICLICFFAIIFGCVSLMEKENLFADEDVQRILGVLTIVTVAWPVVVVAAGLAGPVYLFYCAAKTIKHEGFERLNA